MTDFISREAVLEILRTPTSVDTFPDMIRRVEALEGCGVRVKPLEWENAALVDANDLIIRVADTVVGKYTIRTDGGWFYLWLGSVRIGNLFSCEDDAKAAAQADFDARILAALEPVAQPETPIPGQFETMCLAIEDVITGRGFDVDPWQPIETAPENEGVAHIRGVWVHNATTKKPMYFDVCPGYLEDGGFIAIDGEDHGWRPDDYSHWMPLPQPPGETTSAIPEVVKAYLRNALMVAGWHGERE